MATWLTVTAITPPRNCHTQKPISILLTRLNFDISPGISNIWLFFRLWNDDYAYKWSETLLHSCAEKHCRQCPLPKHTDQLKETNSKIQYFPYFSIFDLPLRAPESEWIFSLSTFHLHLHVFGSSNQSTSKWIYRHKNACYVRFNQYNQMGCTGVCAYGNQLTYLKEEKLGEMNTNKYEKQWTELKKNCHATK